MFCPFMTNFIVSMSNESVYEKSLNMKKALLMLKKGRV